MFKTDTSFTVLFLLDRFFNLILFYHNDESKCLPAANILTACFLAMSNENSGVQVAIRVRKLISREVKACETVKWNTHGQSIWEADRNDSPYTFGLFKV